MKIRTCTCVTMEDYGRVYTPSERPAGIEERDAKRVPSCPRCRRPQPWASPETDGKDAT